MIACHVTLITNAVFVNFIALDAFQDLFFLLILRVLFVVLVGVVVFTPKRKDDSGVNLSLQIAIEDIFENQMVNGPLFPL